MANDPNEKLETDTPESVFPLPLTPLEKFFFWDDRREQPYTFFCDLRFESLVDVEIFEQCVAGVIDRNPLLRANVVGADENLSWQLSDQRIELLDMQTAPPIVDGMIRPIDLRTEVGCRFWCEATEECSRVLVQMHHSACDGIACRGVLIDILHTYALATGNESAGLQETSMLYDRFKYSQLHDRFEYELGKPKRELTTWERVKNAWYFHMQPPTPLRNPRIGVKPDAQLRLDNPICNLFMDREFSQRILLACQSKEYGVNELAIGILFQTCFRWNRRYGDKRRKGRLRILMPYDLRQRTDIRMPATNRLSLAFLGRDYSQCENLSELIASLQAELKDVKDTQLYMDLLNGLKLGCKWPRLVKWVLKQNASMATAVITYTGDISRGMSKLFPEENELRKIGSASLTSIMAAPPARRNTNISMAICINWGRICISAAWNRAVFSEEDCREFLELYKIGWQQWCESEESRRGVYAKTEIV